MSRDVWLTFFQQFMDILKSHKVYREGQPSRGPEESGLIEDQKKEERLVCLASLSRTPDIENPRRWRMRSEQIRLSWVMEEQEEI